ERHAVHADEQRRVADPREARVLEHGGAIVGHARRAAVPTDERRPGLAREEGQGDLRARPWSRAGGVHEDIAVARGAGVGRSRGNHERREERDETTGDTHRVSIVPVGGGEATLTKRLPSPRGGGGAPVASQ